MATTKKAAAVATRAELQARLKASHVHYHRGGNALAAAQERAQIARDALRAVAARIEDLLAYHNAPPASWAENLSHVTASLFEILPEQE